MQKPPSKAEEDRHETLVPVTKADGTPEISVDKESDRWPQRIQPVYHLVSNGPLIRAHLAPHPILCARNGIIDRFPDHMHEGEVVEDEDINLGRPLNIPGYNRPEYPPFDMNIALANGPFGDIEIPFLSAGPRPQVIAHGSTTNMEHAPERFAQIGVYDGDAASIGRIVVDSTWHHWFSYNLVGFEEDNPLVYQNLQAYYRNVALWLSTPAQRASMLYAATWGALTGLSPMVFTRSMTAWEIGEQATDVIGRNASQCMVSALVVAFLKADAVETTTTSSNLPTGQPNWSSIPEELINRAIVGGIGASLLDLALGYKEVLAMGDRPFLDVNAIRELATEGAAQGHRLLIASLDQATKEISAIQARLSAGFRPVPPETIIVPVETARIRLIAERVQFPDATDPALVEAELSLTARVRLNGEVVASRVLDGLERPRFEAHGALVDLELELLEMDVQTGNVITIEVLAGEWTFEEMGSEPIRFKDSLSGDPSSWIGRHQPNREQLWRIWYRVEQVARDSSVS